MLSSRTRARPAVARVRSSSVSRRRPWPRPRAVATTNMRLISADARLEHAQPAAADRRAALVEHEPRRAAAGEDVLAGEDVSVGAKSGPEPLAHELHVLARTAPARPGGRVARGGSRRAARARAAQREDRDVVVRAAATNSSACAVQEADERLGVERARVLGDQRRRGARRRTARRRGAPPSSPSVNANSRSPRPNGASARRSGVVLDAERQPGVAAARARRPRRRAAAAACARRWTSACGRPRRTRGRPARTSSRRHARAQDRVRLREHLGRAVAVPRARLDEEAHHRAERRRPRGPCR